MSSHPAQAGCPPWHFLPGPYADDEDRTRCPQRDTHADQRRRYELAAGQRQAAASVGNGLNAPLPIPPA